MMKHLVYLTICSISWLCLSADTFLPGTFELKKPGFSVLFPGQPMESEATMDSDVKVTLNSFVFKVGKIEDENLLYSLSYVDYPSDYVHSSTTPDLLEDFFQISINKAVKNVNGKLVAVDNITLNSFPGKYTKVEVASGKATIHTKLYLVRSRLYILQVICAAGKDNNGSMATFFDSFKIQ